MKKPGNGMCKCLITAVIQQLGWPQNTHLAAGSRRQVLSRGPHEFVNIIILRLEAEIDSRRALLIT